MNKADRNYLPLIIALIITLLYLAPLYILGQDAHILILDNVDGAVAQLKVLAHSGQVFGGLNSTVPQIMNGLPRNSLGTEFNLQIFLYWLLPAFTAYVTNLTLVHLVALLGMYLLLRRYVFNQPDQGWIAAGVALTFALLPFWPYGGLSVAGQPLVLYAFLNIRARSDRWWDWLILTLVPFYASLIFSFVFFLFMMGLWWLWDLAVSRQLNLRFLGAIILMGAVFGLVEYRLVYNTFLDPGFVSIRSEFPLSRISSFRTAVKTSLINFAAGQYHAASLQQWVILPAVGLALLVGVFKRRFPWTMFGLIFLAGIISLWYGFWFYDGWDPIKQQVGFLREFNMSRFHWLHPLIWYLIFALALKTIAGNRGLGKIIVMLLLTAQVGFLFTQNDELVEKKAGSPTWREFFAADMFGDIRDYIGEDQSDYRVVSIGLHPSISQYNGFYTLDGYASNYPLSYKHEFRQIIARELEKSPFYRDYFDHLGGSRCYIFVEKLMTNAMMDKNTIIVIEKLDLDTGKLQQMGGKYIFSALQINNAKDQNLKLRQVFTDEQSAWKVYLYEVL